MGKTLIKLIATDMDGTLLDSNKQFNHELLDVIEVMKRKEMVFVVASGNQFYHLYNLFTPISDDLYYISENGPYITKGKEELYTFTMDKDLVYKVVHILEEYPELMSVLGGKQKAYILRQYKKYEEEIERHYDVYEYVDSFYDIEDEFLKFSVYDVNYNVASYLDVLKEKLPSSLRVIASAKEWMDIQSDYINKGMGIETLQKHLNISYELCAAFGDSMNDYEMLSNVKYAYAMNNAVEEIKNIAYEVVGDNNHDGVLNKIKEILKGG